MKESIASRMLIPAVLFSQVDPTLADQSAASIEGRTSVEKGGSAAELHVLLSLPATAPNSLGRPLSIQSCPRSFDEIFSVRKMANSIGSHLQIL
jgi:hypothetical protein